MLCDENHFFNWYAGRSPLVRRLLRIAVNDEESAPFLWRHFPFEDFSKAFLDLGGGVQVHQFC